MVKEFSNKLCKEHGLSLTEVKADPFQIPQWKQNLRKRIKKAMEENKDHAGFIRSMGLYGYKVKWEEQHKYITYTTPEGYVCRDNKLFDQTLLRENMEHYFEMGGCDYLAMREEMTEYGELIPTLDDAVCSLASIFEAMATGDNDRFHLETVHHSKEEIKKLLERGEKIDWTAQVSVDDEEQEFESYHGFTMTM